MAVVADAVPANACSARWRCSSGDPLYTWITLGSGLPVRHDVLDGLYVYEYVTPLERGA